MTAGIISVVVLLVLSEWASVDKQEFTLMQLIG